MIDVNCDTLLSLTDAARILPKIDGKRPHPSTLWRWCRRGIHDVRLEYARVGRKIVTTNNALTRFINELAAADQKQTPSNPAAEPAKQCRTPALRRIAIERANEILADNKI